LINLNKIREILNIKKEKEKLSLRDIAQETGVSIATLSRFLKKEAVPETKTVTLLTDWLKLEPHELFTSGEEQNNSNLAISTIDIVVNHIKSDKNLSPTDAETLSETIKMLYERFAQKG